MVLKLQAGVFYGEATRRTNASGFRFTESSYQPGLNLPPHSHELAHFCLVLKGSYTERFGKTCEERRPSTLIFYPPETVHAETSHTGGQHFLIEIESWRAEELRDGAAFQQGPLEIGGQSQQWIVNRLMREFRDGDDLSPLAMESLALELMVNVARYRFSRHLREPPKWLNQARQALEAKFRVPPTLETLAAMVNVHPVHLARSFRRFQGCTISDYVRQLRVDNARRKMMSGNVRLVDIALSSGFSDQSHFSRSFKRVTGMTPTEFRKINGRR